MIIINISLNLYEFMLPTKIWISIVTFYLNSIQLNFRISQKIKYLISIWRKKLVFLDLRFNSWTKLRICNFSETVLRDWFNAFPRPNENVLIFFLLEWRQSTLFIFAVSVYDALYHFNNKTSKNTQLNTFKYKK